MANAPLSPPEELEAAEQPYKKPTFELPNQPKSQVGPQGHRAVRWFFALGVVGLMGTAAYTLPNWDFGGAGSRENWLTKPVSRQRLVLTVTEDGNIESASNIDVKCQVKGGSKILWIVEDGKQVEEGELIVKLDKSTIETQLSAQKIATKKAEALKIQAEQDHAAADIAVREYELGTYVMEHQTLEANVKIALENLRGAENLYIHTERMFKKGFVTEQQLEADEFGVQRSKLELKSAETALRVLDDFTKEKTLTGLKAARDAAKARMESEEAAWQLEVTNLENLESQIANCEILAPQAGMVIHANERNRRSSEVTIEQGALVDEQKTIIKLPDLSRMQVKAKIHETKVEQLRLGMPATVKVQDRVYSGKVVSVANQPEPSSWFSASVKEYAATIAIEGETQRLKPGMTASVEIFVADIPDALVVDVTAVVEQRGKFYVWVVTSDGPERRPVIVGRTNESVIEIQDGLVEGEEVLLNPRAIVEEAREADDAPAEERKLPEGIPTGPDAGRAKPMQSPPRGPRGNKTAAGKPGPEGAPNRTAGKEGQPGQDGARSPSNAAAAGSPQDNAAAAGSPSNAAAAGSPQDTANAAGSEE